MLLKRYALWFGVVILIAGILGYIPAFIANGKLFNIFAVNGFHNLVHVVTGAVAIWAGVTSEPFSRRFFQVFGVIYGIVTLIGLFMGNGMMFGIMAHNWADFWLHLLITVFSLYLGFAAYPVTRRVTP